MLMCFTFATASFASDRAPTKKAESSYSVTDSKICEQQIPVIENNFYCFKDDIEWGRNAKNVSTINYKNISLKIDYNKKLPEQ